MSRQGFTLVELIVTATLMGVLAAVAVPRMMDAQRAAWRSEVPLNVDSIRVAELTYQAAFDRFVPSSGWMPAEDVSPVLRDWKSDPSFEALGWAPEGPVRGSYGVLASTSNVTIWGISDMDGDSRCAVYEATRNAGATLMPHAAVDWY